MKTAPIPSLLVSSLVTIAAAGETKTPPALPDSGTTEVVVTAPRIPVAVKDVPAATTVVGDAVLATMQRGVAADEALATVPGVKIDNQTDGERVHLSIRGQGILTERGIRGIKVVLDGIPLNDPSGFAPDLFDVDWSTLRQIEVLRGPAAALYGGGSAGGVINLVTRDGTAGEVARGSASFGSNGFGKGLAEVGGSGGAWNYRVSLSRDRGDGCRDHAAFWSNKLYGKARWSGVSGLELTGVVAATSFYNENPEGLNLEWMARDRRMANPDANTFNEYQDTSRVTLGVVGRYAVGPRDQLSATLYGRRTHFRESVPSSVAHRTLDNPGLLAQYTHVLGDGPVRQQVTAGADLDTQQIDEYKHPNLGDAVEGPELLADQRIDQRGAGFYLMDRIELGPRWSAMATLRRDHIRNELADHLKANGVNLSGEETFSKTTARVGAVWNPSAPLSLFASWGQGFLPPATEELVNNPEQQGGFNRQLVPATSRGFELGARGDVGRRLTYELALFRLLTDHDFERYRIEDRPLETFYRNAGRSRRYGVEAAAAWRPAPQSFVRVAYTWSDFVYTELVETDGADLSGRELPNTPRHQVYLDAETPLPQGFFAGGGVTAQSRTWVDATNIPYAAGYALVHLRLGYRWTGRLSGEALLVGRNLLDQEYVAFTEPDPDGNSYQPGPGREVFAGVRLWLGNSAR